MKSSLFESFNARPVEPEKVGRGFIYNRIFSDLTKNRHSVVVGQRGSGKTTYFKMLTLPALMNWRDSQRRKIISEIEFTAIYVPTDFSWFSDFRHPVGRSLDPEIDEILAYARFRGSVLRRMLDTVDWCTDHRLDSDNELRRFSLPLSEGQKEELAAELAHSWGIEARFGGLDGLRDAIHDRNRFVQRLISLAYADVTRAKELISENLFLYDKFFDDLVRFADCIARFEGRKRKWAVCFDEVEIAPDAIKREIWRSQRSFDERFLLKLSASPYDDTLWIAQSPNDPMKLNDYDELSLTFDRKDAEGFSAKIWTAICKDFGIPAQESVSMLGTSYYEDNFSINTEKSEKLPDPMAAVHGPTSKRTHFYQEKFNSLAGKDRSFDEFLTRTRIDPDNFASVKGNQRAFVRKFISTVVIRDAYFREQSKRGFAHLASKKAIDKFFTGKQTIFTICEGNPRWLLVVLRPMLEEFLSSSHSGKRVIPRHIQAKSLEDGITTLLSILSTISPTAVGALEGPSLLEIIERAGDFFFEQVLGKEFVPEPTLSFAIDENVDERTLSYLGAALNQGAFSIAPSARNPKSVRIHNNSSLLNLRLRLSYYLAPRYRLPLVLGKERNLSHILLHQRERSAPEKQIMLDLFGDHNDP